MINTTDTIYKTIDEDKIVIQLEHLHLVVNDIEKTLSFCQAAFPQWIVRGGGENEWFGKPRSWIHFGDDYQFLAFNDNGLDQRFGQRRVYC